MRLIRLAGTLVFFQLLAPQAMAASPELQTLDTTRCNHFGKIRICPQFAPPLVLSEEQFEALTKARKPTGPEIQDIMKQNSEQIQHFIKEHSAN